MYTQNRHCLPLTYILLSKVYELPKYCRFLYMQCWFCVGFPDRLLFTVLLTKQQSLKQTDSVRDCERVCERERFNFQTTSMDVMALECRSMAAMAMPCKVARQAKLQRTARAAVTKLNAISGGARFRLSEEIYLREAALSTSSLCGRGRSGGRDWRVCLSGNANGQLGEDGGRRATRLNATVEKANDAAGTEDKNMQMFGSSEASCDEGSSYLAVESILENEGGKSVEDYKHRAHIFSESDIFFTALKDRNSSHSVNQ